MSAIMPTDHHATFSGWTAQRRDGTDRRWSSRKGMGVFVICALASWILVLSPFVLFN